MRGWLLVALLAACAPAVPELPSRGGPAWVEVASPHFDVWTDSSEARARELAQQMEDYRRVVITVLFGGTEVKTPMTLVFALRDQDEVGAYVSEKFAAETIRGSMLMQPAIVVAANLTERNMPVFMHELTHAITGGVVQHQPLWLAEGLAGYFESIKTIRGAGAIELGRPPRKIVLGLRGSERLSSAAMFECVHDDCTDSAFYGRAWQTFAFLMSSRPQQLGDYLNALAKLPYGPYDIAAERAVWDRVFPDLPPERLDHAVAVWWATGRAAIIRLPSTSVPVAMTARPLRDADALAVRGTLLHVHGKPGADAQLAAALAADPTELVARLIATARAHGVIAPADARATVDAHPGDWRAWFLLVEALRENSPEWSDAKTNLCALVRLDSPPTFVREICDR